MKTTLIAVLMAAVCGVAAEPFSWTFETGTDGWQPRATTIELNRQEGEGALTGSHACLQIRGPIEDGWNYALTGHFPLHPGQTYRLTAWVLVRSLGSSTPAPFLKCEMLGPPGQPYLGQITTSSYDLSKPRTWQRLEGEFQAPDAAQSAWLALEKGTSQPTELDALLDDVSLTPIPRLTALDQFRLDPLPPALEKTRGKHPRLFLDAHRVAELRQAIKTTHVALWRELREQADLLVRRGAPTYRKDDNWSGEEQLWQREVGNAMPVLAMAWLLTQDATYLNAARDWALASCSYPTWGLGRIDGMDLAAGHQLLGLAIVYDWCHDNLGDAARQTIRDTLNRRTDAIYEAAATGKVWWQRSYLQNHLWVNICGMSAAGFALFDEVDDASGWIALPLRKFEKTMSVLGPDGASHEGYGYWEYGVEYMMKFMDLARALLDVDLYDRAWWRQTALYPQYLSLPRHAWTPSNCIVDIADCPRGHWYGPDYLLRGLAHTFHDPHAQWLAARTDEADVAAKGASWLNLVWFDPAVPEKSPADLPTLKHFTDLDIVSARSDWSGDESLLVFKCGPFIGHRAIHEFSSDPGGGHVHPDANHFVLFAEGEWLIRDDGYRAKWTGQHNTLLVDGQGQLGEGKMWFDGSVALRVRSEPRILRAESSPTLDRISGDATEAYPRQLGLHSYIRHLLFLKPDVLIVCDDITADAPKDLELRFHPEHALSARDHNAFLFNTSRSALRLDPLTPENVTMRAEDVPAADRHSTTGGKMFTVRLMHHAKTWRNAVALTWSPAGQPPVKVTAQSEGSTWHFTAGDRTVDLDWQSSR